MGRATSLVFAILIAACGTVETNAADGPQSPDAPPETDGPVDAQLDATDGPVDAEIDATDAPPPISCTAGEFIECAGANASFCNSTGDGYVQESCGAPGCNATAGRCNECAPSQAVCDGMVLERCGADGLPLADEPCQRACLAAPTPHCEQIVPAYLPTVCDGAAAMPAFTVSASATIDTGLDVNCTGGVLTQSGGPPVCVMRYGTISIQSGRTLTLVGGRAAALVSDGALSMAGIIDASATGTSAGPGSSGASGGLSSSTVGGGGAGARTAGAAGGTSTVTGGAGNGGPAFDPTGGTVLIGGRSAASPTVGLGVSGGGGGGAVALISCRGTVTVTGTIDLGGGGGRGGTDLAFGSQLNLRGGGGGGAGGYGVIQGLAVNVTGFVFANGGGGGGGGANDASGGAGGDGPRSNNPAAGGAPLTGGGAGGAGGYGASGPGGGGASGNSAGGGGGAAGWFKAFAPQGGSVVLTPSSASPGFAATGQLETR